MSASNLDAEITVLAQVLVFQMSYVPLICQRSPLHFPAHLPWPRGAKTWNSHVLPELPRHSIRYSAGLSSYINLIVVCGGLSSRNRSSTKYEPFLIRPMNNWQIVQPLSAECSSDSLEEWCAYSEDAGSSSIHQSPSFSQNLQIDIFVPLWWGYVPELVSAWMW